MSRRSTKNGTRQSCFRWWTLQSRRRLCSAEMLFTLWGAGISPEPHKPCHFRQLKWFYNSRHIHIATQALQTLQWEGSWMRAVAVLAIWCSFCPALNLNGFGVHDFAANAEPHQTCDETSPIDTSPALWLHPATTTYSTCWCVLEPSSRKVVWTRMARRLLGLTKFSAVLPWRLGLTHANLEESTSCTPSCHGPSWHLESWLLKRNGLTTYRNFKALSDSTWMHWMRYQAAQARYKLRERTKAKPATVRVSACVRHSCMHLQRALRLSIWSGCKNVQTSFAWSKISRSSLPDAGMQQAECIWCCFSIPLALVSKHIQAPSHPHHISSFQFARCRHAFPDDRLLL